MDQYQIQNAVHKIDGYHLPHPLEPLESSFTRAKADTIAQLKKDLADVENTTQQQFESVTRRSPMWNVLEASRFKSSEPVAEASPAAAARPRMRV